MTTTTVQNDWHNRTQTDDLDPNWKASPLPRRLTPEQELKAAEMRRHLESLAF